MKTKLYFFTAIMLLTLVVSAQTEPKVYETYFQEWINNAWADTLRTTNTYDTNGNLIKVSSAAENPVTNEWQDTVVMNYTLNTDATVKEMVTQIWEQGEASEEGEWIDVFKTIYTYNEAKKVLSETHQTWLAITWADIAKTDFTYENDLLTKQVTQITTLVSPELVNSEQIIYTYNSDGTEKDNIVQIWNTDTWVNTTRSTNTYDASKKLTTVMVEKWENETWLPDSKTTNTYTESGSLIQSMEETYTENAWVNASNTLNSYNANGELENTVFQIWDDSVSQWDNQFRFVYKYTPTGLHRVELAGLTAFPNPFEDHLIIQSSLQGAYGLEIINSSGQLIQSIETQENTLRLNLKALKRGMYFIKVKTPQNERSIKVLKGK